MGTIIAHGKSQWGRANKNIRIDAELEAEKEAIARHLPKSVGTNEADILKGISENILVGEKVITRVSSDVYETEKDPIAIEIPNESHIVLVSDVVEEINVSSSTKKIRSFRRKSVEPVVEEIVPIEEVVETPKPKKKKINKKKKVEISAPTDTTSFISDKAYTLEIEKDII